MNDTAIDIQSVAKSYRSKKVLNDLTLSVPTGKTFAFLGRNGAGKTTTIRMLLGQLKPNAGQLRILGLDVARQPLEVRRRIGYLAEDQQMFGWMKVAQILKFMKPFYPTWDDTLADKYLKTFELPPKTRIKHLSKGQNCRLGLLLALAHRPELVILDDPTLGLDPIMRKELLRDVIDHLQGQGVTVFFSSHLLYEIEPVADIVAILDHGHIVKQAPTEQLRDQVKQVILTPEDYDTLAPLQGQLDVSRHNNRVAVVTEAFPEVQATLQQRSIQARVVDLNLDEIFEAYVIGKHHEQRDDKGTGVERVA
ncbi:MAG: ABC transporter ATP-binding protein [Phycisphaeraceae bacterium]|nr:ABC transporter ATP-binding protein [Phycisphaeraceae bacterium]